MGLQVVYIAVVCLLAHEVSCVNPKPLLELPLKIPADYKVTSEDTYVCTVVDLPDRAHKLVGVVPVADQAVVHHILLYGCLKPWQQPEQGKAGKAWDCMQGGTCAEGGEILYGWGSSAPHLQLPEGVGFSVGGGTSIRYIVAQVHFLGVRPPKDESGVILLLRPYPTPFAAGLLAYAANFVLPPDTPSTKVPNECCYQGHQPVTTFAFRVHTHTMGRSVSMTREMWNRSGAEVVAINNPQLPQAFYPVKRQVIWPGDRLKVTCDFNTVGQFKQIKAGSTHMDEMCNLYMMVYAPHPVIVMCSNGIWGAQATTPGTLPAGGTWLLDPCPFWLPPYAHVGRGIAAAEAVPKAVGTAGAGEAALAGARAAAAGTALGEVTGVTLGGDGSLWTLHRGGRVWSGSTFLPGDAMADKSLITKPVVAQLNPETGQVLASWGANLFSMPHMIYLDSYGNVWVTDVGLHQVLKLSNQGKVLLRLGTLLVPGKGKTHFCKPTHVAVARDGTVYVADGYCNSRVVKFDVNGKYMGEAAIPLSPGGWSAVVHSLVLDECRGVLYVAAREDGKVYTVDTTTLTVTATTDVNRRVWSLHMGPYGMPLGLVWEVGKDAELVNVMFPTERRVLPGLKTLFPHQVALGAAPTALTGASDRLFALYVAPVCETGCGSLQRFVLVPPGLKMPEPAVLLPANRRGGLADGAGNGSALVAAAALQEADTAAWASAWQRHNASIAGNAGSASSAGTTSSNSSAGGATGKTSSTGKNNTSSTGGPKTANTTASQQVSPSPHADSKRLSPPPFPPTDAALAKWKAATDAARAEAQRAQQAKANAQLARPPARSNSTAKGGSPAQSDEDEDPAEREDTGKVDDTDEGYDVDGGVMVADDPEDVDEAEALAEAENAEDYKAKNAGSDTHEVDPAEGAAKDGQEFGLIVTPGMLHGKGVASWRGSGVVRFIALMAFAGAAAVAVALLSLRAVRKYYLKDEPVMHTDKGSTIDDILARSAELTSLHDGTEYGNGGPLGQASHFNISANTAVRHVRAAPDLEGQSGRASQSGPHAGDDSRPLLPGGGLPATTRRDRRSAFD